MKNQPASFRDSERQQKVKRCYLYVIQHGTDLICLTNYDTDVVVTGLPARYGTDPQTFIAAPVQSSAFEQSTELNAPKVTVSVAINSGAESAAMKKYFVAALPKQMQVTIMQVSSDALPGPIAWGTDLFVIFRGLKTNLGFNRSVVVMQFVNLMLQGDGQVPRFYYQKLCQHAHGSSFCGVDLEAADNSMTVLVTAVDRVNRRVDIAETHINGHVIGGPITFEFGKLVELDGANVVAQISIIANEALPAGAGTRFHLMFWSNTLAVGTSIRVYRGCRRTTAACTSYSNLANFGGMPYIPSSNPAVDGIIT